MPRPKPPADRVTVQQDKFIRMEANGASREDKLREVFGLTPDDPKARACDCKMSRWRRLPMYDTIWKQEVASQDYSDFITARRKLRESMHKKDDWLQMQSAVNVLNATTKRIYGAEENTVTVHIEGMPDLGSPDQDEG